MRIKAWRAFIVAGTAAIACDLLLLPDDRWKTGIYAGISLSAVIAAVVGVRRYRPRRPAVWWALAVGLLCEVTGDIVYAVNQQFPSMADGFYLGGSVVLAISVVLLLRARRAGSDRAGAIDATVVATGIGLLSWVFLMAPEAASSDLNRAAQLVSLAYPVWDVMSVALTVRLLVSAGTRIPAVRLLVAAPVAWLIADTVGAVQLQYNGYTQDGLINAFWLLGFVLYGAAALHPSMRELTQAAAEPSRRLSRSRLALLTGASLIAPALLLGQTLLAREQVDDVAIGIASTVLFLLVVLRIGGLVRQVEEQAAELTTLAQRDGLTGIPNRRSWDSELPIAMERARRDNVPLCIALLDLDNFKRFNDEYGHQAGDRLLKSATAVWSGSLRQVDILCRYGGEEFGVILPDATAQQATEILDRLRGIMPLAQTFSAGVACWDGREISDELVGRADRALYTAKDAGRDRVFAATTAAIFR